MNVIQSRKTEKKGNKPCNIDLKISTKILFQSTDLPFLSSEPKILKAFPNTFPTKMKPTKSPAKEKKMRQKNENEGKRESKTLKSRLPCHF